MYGSCASNKTDSGPIDSNCCVAASAAYTFTPFSLRLAFAAAWTTLCLICVSLFFLAPSVVFAQSSQQGTVVGDEAQVYQDADFDSPVIAVLKPGSVYSISIKQKGPFYKIRVKPGVVGWIVDTDVRAGVVKVTPETKKQVQREKEKIEEEQAQRPFFATRYWGPVFEYLNYTEDTMGKDRSAGMLFYGLKWSGFNTVFSGEIYTDANVIFHLGAPKYYEDVTGQGAGGYIVNANFLLQTVRNLSKTMIFFYGLGPMLRYSYFDLHLPGGASSTSYSAEDLALGAVFNLGVAWRLGKFSLRPDLKYYWEKNKYYGAGLGVGYEF